jgi:hypothetical protein
MNSYFEREDPTGAKEEHDDVNEADILGLADVTEPPQK